MDEVLSGRALNRATLARQLLLERDQRTPLATVEHLVGMQAQVPHNPYTGLWSRLEGFRPESLSELLERREVVRVGVMRGTIHLVTADDCLLLRPLVQPVFEAQLRRHPEHGAALRVVDLAPVVTFARALLAEKPRSGTELRAIFAERFPDLSPAALAHACQMHLAFVQVPPRGLWGTERTGEVDNGGVVARPAVRRRPLDRLGRAAILRGVWAGLVADVTTWCRLTGMRAVVERLRPQLVTFGTTRGRELFDVPDAPRPSEDTPAPVRFLPEYDNVVLSHDDRSRFFDHAHRAALVQGWTIGWGSVLHDGVAVGVVAAGAGGAGRPPCRSAVEEGARCDRRGGSTARAVPRGGVDLTCGWSPLSP